MSWKDKLQSNREPGQPGTNSATNTLMEEQWPRIQQLLQEKVGPAALAAAQNDQAMEVLLKKVYIVLPFPVRMIVNEGAFVTFCLSHRDRLLAAPASPPAAAPAPTE